jgi:IS605 OrfB family transposase
VASPSGVAIMTRLRTTPEDEVVLDAVAAHLSELRRGDLAAVCRPPAMAAGLDPDARRRLRRDRLNTRKSRLTARSSARWANAIISENNDQYRLARDAQYRQIVGLRAAIATIEKRLAAPTSDTVTPEERIARRGQLKGYATQTERFAKQRRLQRLRAELARTEADREDKRVRVTDGTKRLAKARHHLDAAGLTLAQWRHKWECARDRIQANGSWDEPFGNLTITVTPNGQVSLRLPKPLEHFANAKQGRYVLSAAATFSYRADEWVARITGGQSVSYAISHKPGRAGRYLTASWAAQPQTSGVEIGSRAADVFASGPVVAVDLNDGHLALRRLDSHGNPVGKAAQIDFDLYGTSTRRDAHLRHAITRLIHYTLQHGIGTIAVEDLNFVDARTVGRETMGRGQRGKRFRKTVASMPTAVFRNRLSAQTSQYGIQLLAVNPAYTSVWGEQHWRKPYENVTRHQAAATVIGRRAQGHTARRREGVTRTRPEDRGVRATNQTAPHSQQATTDSRHRPGMRGAKSCPPGRARTRLLGRATVTPAAANTSRPHP